MQADSSQGPPTAAVSRSVNPLCASPYPTFGEVHAVDYLPKPVGRERFEAALVRAKDRVSEKKPAPAELAAAARPPQQFLERVVVRDGTRVTLIPVAKLDYVEAQDDYVALATHGAKHLKQQTISSLEAGLEPARFVRIHRSYIVNFERGARIEPYGKDSRLAILIDGTRRPSAAPATRA